MSARFGLGETFGRSRRAAILLNVVVMVVLACGVGVAVVYLTGYTAFKKRFDLTAAQSYTLSPETEQILDALDRDIEILTVFDKVQIPSDPDGARVRAMDYCLSLLQEYKVRGHGRLSIDELDPRLDLHEVAALLRELGIGTYNVVVVRDRDRPERRKVLGLETDLAEFELRGPMGPWALVSYRAEEALTAAILEITQGEPTRVQVLSGHGEMSITDYAQAGAFFVASLLRQDNCTVEQLSLNVKKEVPEGTDVVLVLGPREPFLADERAALDAWLRKGGRLLIALDPNGDTSLDELVGRLGARLDRDIVVYEARGTMKAEQAGEIWIGSTAPGDFGVHPITEGFDRTQEEVVVARSGGVSAAPGAEQGYSSLLLSPTEAFGDTRLPGEGKTEGDWTFDARVEKRGQRGLAAALEPGGEYPGARIVLVPSTLWASNHFLSQVPSNQKFLRRAIAWLAGEERTVRLPPRVPRMNVAELRPDEYDAIWAYVALWMPGGALVLSFLVWLARRR